MGAGSAPGFSGVFRICRRLLLALQGATGNPEPPRCPLCSGPSLGVMSPIPLGTSAGGIAYVGHAIALGAGGPSSMCVSLSAQRCLWVSPLCPWSPLSPQLSGRPQPGRCQRGSVTAGATSTHRVTAAGTGAHTGAGLPQTPKGPCPGSGVRCGVGASMRGASGHWRGGGTGWLPRKPERGSPTHREGSSRPCRRWRGKGNICSMRSWFAET